MSIDNKYIVFLIALLMSLSLIGASGAVAVDRTVLNADHLSDTVGEEGVYEELAADSQENISTQIDKNLDGNASTRPPGVTIDFDSEEIATNAVTAEFFAGEFDRNFERLIGFLNGETDELDLWLDLATIYDSVAEQFTADSVSVDTVTVAQQANLQSAESSINITDEMLARLNEDEDGYQSVRTEIRSQGLQNLPVEFDSSGSVCIDTVRLAQESDLDSGTSDVEVTDSMIERMNENSTGYEAVRRDIRDQVRDSLPPRATEEQVDQALLETSEELKTDASDQARADYGDDVSEGTLQDIIALQNTVIDGLTDPELSSFAEYERQREAAEQTLEASLDDEIDTALQEANDKIKTDAAEQARTEYGDELDNETLQNVIALQNTVIDGLTDPELDSFNEHETRRTSHEAAVETSLAAEIRAQITEGSENRVNLSEGIDEDSERISTVRSGVGLINLSTVALPVIFLLLLGALYVITRSPSRTGRATGYALVIAGVLGAIGGLVAGGPVITALEPDTAGAGATEAAFMDAFVSVIESLFSTLVTQSAVLAVVGLGLVGAVYVKQTTTTERAEN